MAVIDQQITDQYAIYNGDSCEVLPTLPDKSVGLSVYSPPFADLYNYFAGHGFIRVDVPETTGPYGDQRPAFSKVLGPSSIYAITPCTEEVARAAAASSYTPQLAEVAITDEMVRRKAERLGMVDPKALPNATAADPTEQQLGFEDDDFEIDEPDDTPQLNEPCF